MKNFESKSFYFQSRIVRYGGQVGFTNLNAAEIRN